MNYELAETLGPGDLVVLNDEGKESRPYLGENRTYTVKDWFYASNPMIIVFSHDSKEAGFWASEVDLIGRAYSSYRLLHSEKRS